MKIILFEPQIPQNTGNIVRTCNVTNSGLVLVKPFGFNFSSRLLKRAGLDYWQDMQIEIIEDLYSYLKHCSKDFYFFSSKAPKIYTNVQYPEDTFLIFGSETTGLPAIFWETWPEKFLTVPMASQKRCLNLSNTVAIALYEGLRQQSFNFA